MFVESSQAIQLIQASKYWMILILMIIEGPTITYIASFFASLNYFNIFIIFLLSSIGNIIGDLTLFFLGRSGKIILSKKYQLKINKKIKLKKLEKYLITNPGKAILIIKTIPPLPLPGLILTGSSKIKTRTFLFYSISFSLIFSAIFTTLGFFSGNAFKEILKYVNNATLIISLTIIVSIIIFKIINLFMRKTGSELVREVKTEKENN